MNNPIVVAFLAFLGGMACLGVAAAFWMALKTVREGISGVRELAALTKESCRAMDSLSKSNGEQLGAFMAKAEVFRNATLDRIERLRDTTLQSLDNKELLGALKTFPHLAATGVKLSSELEGLQKILKVIRNVAVNNEKVMQAKAEETSAVYTYTDELAAMREARANAGNTEEDATGGVPAGRSEEV